MPNKRIVLALFLLSLVLVVAGCSGTSTPTAQGTPTANPAQAAVTAKGAVVPAQYARLGMSTGGTILKLNIKEGDKVKAGDVLVELDTTDLTLQIKAAQDGLDLANKGLTQAKTPASAEEITAAQAAYASAVAALNQARRGPTVQDLKILQANLAKAKAALDQAQAAYDRAGGPTNPYAGMLPTSLQLQEATLDYQIAQANYDKATKLDATVIEQAQAGVTQAKAQLDLKQKGPRPEDIAVAQVRVQQAQTGLEQAQSALTKAKLVAPFDGTVTNLTFHVGELAQPGVPGITLADLSQLRIDTTDLDEFGAARIKLGQPVKITVNAFNDKQLTGKVSSIASQSVTLATGDISYIVGIALDNQDPDIRWGMTVKVEFANK
ncbi:MAG: efflux RND transporter periplasmic adaptor subunit [Anaerolineae bacterium]